ncbi:hypothetical protein TSAR_002648 [Trichomalopsis sarcophagae]|uniref:oligopeptidase A n=1 Tax=Trichomalopsis sarcophagae TaxID=543379 RepID=A0A232F6T5_9HYME|nr:hypothetical protein TSAR_002648 [Trichomalopsis sarcophagae]
MTALICGRRIFSMRNSLFKAPRRKESGYYVLLPEIGEDLPEKNPLLKEETMLPEFNRLSIERCIAAIGKQTIEFEQGIKALEKDIEESKNLDIFKDVFEPIEKLEIPLQTTWGISKVLYFGNQSLMPTKSYLSIHKRAWTAISQKYDSQPLNEACKKVNEDTQKLTDEQKRILQKYLLEGRLNGLNLDETERHHFRVLIRQISMKSEEFRQKLEVVTNLFKHKITDPQKMKGFPEEFLKTVAVDPAQYEVGPWIITLKPHIVQTFMEYCPDGLERFNIWLSNVLKCSNHGEQEVETASLVNGITSDRCEIARYLGFKHFAEMSMSTKMAGSLDNVYKFLDTLRNAAFPHQIREIDELTDFARERGFEGLLKQWDVPYWARKQKRTLYNYDEEILKEYFPLPKVLEGLFKLIKNLFNVEIIEREKVDVWHKDVRFFDVYDLEVSDSEPVGSFYFDPYARGDQKLLANRHFGWVLIMRNKSVINGTKPLTSLIYNFQPPLKDGTPSLLTFRGVQSLFENFGHVLQQVLTRVNSAEIAGLSNIEWDAASTSKHLMAHWVYEPEVLKSISSHCETGETLDDETIENLRRSRTHMSGFNLCKELYLCKFDLDLHSIRKPWEAIMKKNWKEHFVFPEDKKDSHVCSWDAIFVDNLGAAYYSDLWSKMLAADVYSAFQESHGDADHQRKIGGRFKDTFLSLGGSVPANEVFRRFRGRDPSLKALIKHLKIN